MTFNKSIAQIDCLQNDGNYSYTIKLNIDDLPSDFNKNDFINHVMNIDNISSQDTNTLNSNITSVEKIFPSLVSHRSISVIASADIVSVLSILNNSINSYHCYLTDCEQSDGTYSYYVLLTSDTVPDGFDKNDFINFISANDNISSSIISTLNQEITLVSTPFDFANNPFYQRIIAVESNSELFTLFDGFTNSIEFHECRYLCIDDECLLDGTLSISDFEKLHNAIIYPNPIKDESFLYLNYDFTEAKLEIIDNLGKIIFEYKISNTNKIDLRNINLKTGIYYFKIRNIKTQNIKIIKVIKK